MFEVHSFEYFLCFLLKKLMMKMYSAKYGPMIVELMDKIVGIFAENARTTLLKRLILMQKYSFFTELVLKLGLLAYALAGVVYLFTPIYFYYFNREIIPIIPLFFLFIDENTTVGYMVLTSIHVVFIILAVISSACTDFMFAMIIVNAPELSNIFRDNVEELNDILKEEKVNNVLAKAKLRNILLMHREIWE